MNTIEVRRVARTHGDQSLVHSLVELVLSLGGEKGSLLPRERGVDVFDGLQVPGCKSARCSRSCSLSRASRSEASERVTCSGRIEPRAEPPGMTR